MQLSIKKFVLIFVIILQFAVEVISEACVLSLNGPACAAGSIKINGNFYNCTHSVELDEEIVSFNFPRATTSFLDVYGKRGNKYLLDKNFNILKVIPNQVPAEPCRKVGTGNNVYKIDGNKVLITNRELNNEEVLTGTGFEPLELVISDDQVIILAKVVKQEKTLKGALFLANDDTRAQMISPENLRITAFKASRGMKSVYLSILRADDRVFMVKLIKTGVNPCGDDTLRELMREVLRTNEDKLIDDLVNVCFQYKNYS